jgi:hypothetical protein
MHLEWFDRVCGELQNSLRSICEKYDKNVRMLIERGAKHPRIGFFSVSGEEDRGNFCTLYFDPPNEEFYVQSIDRYYGHLSKVVLNDLEDIINVVHESFHNHIDENLSEEEIRKEESNLVGSAVMKDELLLEEIDVDWETQKVTAYNSKDEVEVSYRFGLAQDTGEGIIKRINRKSIIDGNLLKEETIITFSKEEASKLIAMIASHMASLNTMDDHV